MSLITQPVPENVVQIPAAVLMAILLSMGGSITLDILDLEYALKKLEHFHLNFQINDELHRIYLSVQEGYVG